MPYNPKTGTFICRRYRSFGPFEYDADFSQAASGIRVRFLMDDDYPWQSIPYQVADAQHDPRKAEQLIVDYFS